MTRMLNYPGAGPRPVPDFMLHLDDETIDRAVNTFDDAEYIRLMGMTDEEIHDGMMADIQEHQKQRLCPEGCGCVEFYDDRQPERSEGSFGRAGCECKRCDG